MHEPNIAALCIYVCPRHVWVCVCVRASDSTGLVIRAKQTFHCSHRIIAEPRNGTCCILSQDRTACGLLGIIHADLTHRKTCPGPKQTPPLNPLQLPTSTLEQNEGLVAHLIRFHHPADLLHRPPCPIILICSTTSLLFLPNKICLICVTIEREADWIIWIV